MKMAAVVGFLIAVGPCRALAQPGPPPTMPTVPPPPTVPATTEPPQTTTQFYGWQLLMADGLFTALALRSQRAEPVIGLIIAGPLIHGLHGRGDAAVGSLLLRATLPVLGLVVGDETCNERPVGDDLGCLDNIYIGFAVGAAVAAGLDYLALARKPVTTSPARVRPAVTVTPTASSAGVVLDF